MNQQVEFKTAHGRHGPSSRSGERFLPGAWKDLAAAAAVGAGLAAIAVLAQGVLQVPWIGPGILLAIGLLGTWYARQLIRRRLDAQRRRLEREFSERSAELIETERRFNEYGETASEWFWETDTEDRLVFVSSRLYEASGVRPEDVLGRRRESFRSEPMSDADRAMWAEYRRCIENRLPFENLRYRGRIADSREIVYCSSGKPFYDDDGRFLGYRGTARDATGEIAEERRRQADQALIYNATALLNDGFYIFDADDRLVMCNRRFREIYCSVADLLEPGVPYQHILRAIADRQIVFADEQEKRAWLETTLAAHADPGEPFEEHLTNGEWIRVVKQRLPDGNLVGLCVDITPIKRIEEELAEAQRISSTGSYRMDFVTDRMISVSPQLAKIYGIDETALLAGDDPYLYDLVYPDDLERVRSAYRSAKLGPASKEGDLIFEIEYRIRRSDGDLRHIVERTAASKVDQGRVLELIGTLQDVTERRQIEQELEAAQQIAQVGSFRWDMVSDRASSMSVEMSNIYARPLGQLLSFSVPEFARLIIYPEDRGRVLETYRGAGERGKAYEVEYRILRPDGELRYVLERAEVSDRRDGEAREFLGILRDVTEEKLTERELETAQGIAGVGSYRYDLENQRVVSYSKEYLRIHGRSAEQMDALGADGLIEQIIHPQDRQRVRAAFERSAIHDESYEIEYRIRRPDGEYRYVVERCETSVRRDGKPVEQLGTLLDTTELRQFEKELEDAQRMARIGSFRWDVERRRLISCSRQYLEIHGMSRELAMSLNEEQLKPFVHPDDLDRLFAAYRLIDETGEDIEIEYRLLRPDGEVRYVIERIGVSLWRDGRPVEQLGTIQDLTERRLFEHQLEEAQRIAGVGSFHYSVKDNMPISMSTEMLRIYGRSNDELMALDDAALIELTVHPDDRQRVAEFYAKHDQSNEEYQIEFRLLRPDGELRTVVERAEPLLTRDGRMVELLGTLQDVTELRREEERRRAADAMLEAAIENVPGGFLLVSSDGIIERFNRRFVDLYPYQRWSIEEGVAFERFIDDGLAQDFYVDALQLPEEWKRRRLEMAQGEQAGCVERTADGRSIQVAMRRLPNGNVVSMHVDVTELERAREAAEQANAAKSDFLASMSHELRTPMHAILSFADLGIKRIDRLSQEKLVQYLDNIRVSGNRLLFLLNDLLDLAKLEAGKMKLDIAPLNLADLVQSCIDEQAARLRDKKLDCELVNRLPADCCACDSNRIYQVISNLVSNAIKFSPQGGRIEIGLERIDGVFRFAVVDEGIGIPADDLEQVFDKFYQSAHSRGHSGGTGLGLAICREIIGLHGGRIWAENNAGRGSRVIFELPAQSGRR